MKKRLALLLALVLILPVIASCAEIGAPAEGSADSSDGTASSYHEDLPETEPPATEPDEDPFEGADPIPEDFAFPDNLTNPDGTVIGTIVLPPAATGDEKLVLAAEELRLHIEKVTGANLPVVGRTCDACGSLILATPETLPAITEWFADDLAWLADLGSVESGSRFGSDGFAIRSAGDDVYIIGNTSRGALNGAYDLLEENLGILWVWADEEKGTFYDETPSVTISKVNYREKSPFEYRSWNLCALTNIDSSTVPAAQRVCSRNKENAVWVSSTDPYYLPFGHTIKGVLMSSPIYDPEETEYWQTDEEGNPISAADSLQPNPFSEKTIEALAASVIQTMQNTGTRKVFLGAEDNGGARYVPYDTQPFEYAPGQFVNPEDENYYSTVIHTMVNKVARIVRESVPDGMVGTWAYWIEMIPPACEIEDNVYIVFAPINEDMCYPLCDTAIKEKKVSDAVKSYCDWIVEWSQKTDKIAVYNYYLCSKILAYAERPIWKRMQTDFQDYVKLGIIGLNPEGCADETGQHVWFQELGLEGGHRAWDMNALSFWLYGKLSWNPYEDLQSLIDEFCEKVYGPAAESMREYYRILENSWETVSKTYKRALNHGEHYSFFYRDAIYKAGIGHDVVDTLNSAYEAAVGPVKEVIGYIRDCYWKNLSSFHGW